MNEKWQRKLEMQGNYVINIGNDAQAADSYRLHWQGI